MRNFSIAIVSLSFFFVLFLFDGMLAKANQVIISAPNTKKIVNEPSKSLAYQQSPIIYLVPHADDEILTYGIDILNSIRLGRQVRLILFSPSVSSSAFEIINGRDSQGRPVYDGLLHMYHNPIKEKYQDGYLTRDAFGEARIRELLHSAQELGVPSSNISINHINNINTQDATDMIQQQLNMYPHAEFRTMSKGDFHPEHALLGQVLQSFVDRHQILPSQVRYLISIYTDRFDKTIKQRLGLQAYLSLSKKERTDYLINPIDRKHLQAAMNVYKNWQPSIGWYAIGYHSVPEQFQSLERNMYTRHYPAVISSTIQVNN